MRVYYIRSLVGSQQNCTLRCPRCLCFETKLLSINFISILDFSCLDGDNDDDDDDDDDDDNDGDDDDNDVGVEEETFFVIILFVRGGCRTSRWH